jgi:NADH dehydrogenase
MMNRVEDQVGYFALAQAHGFRFHYDALAGLDLSARTIRLAAVENRAGGEVVLNPREPEYDDLVLAFASQVNDFGIEGVIEHCHFLDSSAQASATFCDQLPDFTQKGIESCKVTRYSFA